VFRGTLPSEPTADSVVALNAPWLWFGDHPIESEHTLWTIAPLPGLVLDSDQPAISSATPIEANRVRAAAVETALRAAMQSAIGESAANDWAQRCVARLVAYRTPSNSSTDASTESLVDADIAAWLNSIYPLSSGKKSFAVEHAADAISALQSPFDADDLFAEQPVAWVFDGRHELFTLALSNQPSSYASNQSSTTFPVRAAWAATLAVLAGAACFALGRKGARGRARTLWMRGRYAMLAAAGLVWWLWLWPSFLGLAMILAAVLLAIWPIRTHATASSGSSFGSDAVRKPAIES